LFISIAGWLIHAPTDGFSAIEKAWAIVRGRARWRVETYAIVATQLTGIALGRICTAATTPAIVSTTELPRALKIGLAAPLAKPIFTNSARITFGVLGARLLLNARPGAFVTEEVACTGSRRARVNADFVFTDAVSKALI